MSEPFLAEIRIVGFTFAPRGWALCDGQILPINQNQSLYSLLGTLYGGDGRTSFALPDLRGRTPIHAGSGSPISQGQEGGEETHALSAAEMPAHRHALVATDAPATTPIPAGHRMAQSAPNEAYHYGPANDLVATRPASMASVGAGTAHENMQPYLALNFAIALQGLFPSRN